MTVVRLPPLPTPPVVHLAEADVEVTSPPTIDQPSTEPSTNSLGTATGNSGTTAEPPTITAEPIALPATDLQSIDDKSPTVVQSFDDETPSAAHTIDDETPAELNASDVGSEAPQSAPNSPEECPSDATTVTAPADASCADDNEWADEANALQSSADLVPEAMLEKYENSDTEAAVWGPSTNAVGFNSSAACEANAAPPITAANTPAVGEAVGQGATGRPGSAKKPLTRVAMISHAQALAAAERLGAGKSFFHTTMKDISELGVGLQLYFMFTKYMGLCFLGMSVLALPALIMHGSGYGIDTQMIDPMRLSLYTMANEGVNSTGNATTQWCLGNPFTQDPFTTSYIITACDLLYSAGFVFFIWYFKHASNQVIAMQADAITPAKYAVFVRGLPPSATEASVLQHFNQRYNPTADRKEFPMRMGCWGRPRPPKHRPDLTHGGRLTAPVSNTDHLVHGPNALYVGTFIAEVSIAHPTGGLLRTFLAMEHLTAKVAELNDILSTLKSPAAEVPDRDKLTTKVEEQLEKVTDTLERKTARMKELRANGASTVEACECAFVVFNSVEAQQRCLRDYRTSGYSYARYFQPKDLRFEGKYPLHVRQAPEPSNIMWENLEVSATERRLRRYFTNFITFLLLLLSCAIISLAQSAQAKFSAATIPNFCSEALPAVFTGNYSTIPNYAWKLYWNQYPNVTCPLGSYYVGYTNKVAVTVPARGNATQCLGHCISTTTTLDKTCSTLPCFDPALVDLKTRPCTTYLASDLLKCYCEPALERAIQLYGWIDGPRKMYNYELPCQGYLKNYLAKNSALFLAAVTVIVVNLFLQTVLRAFADFERHTSESDRTSAMVLKLFFAQLLNTGIIVLLVNANLSNVPLPLSLSEILHGQFDDFVRQWYISVGVGISTTMIINAVSPQLGPLLQTYVIGPIRRWRALRAAVTQKQMNELFAGPPFDISLRYPLVLNTVFVTMMYCGGIPILLPVASLSCLVMHQLDKLTIMRLYSVRTAYDEALGQLSLAMLPLALLLHLAFSTWMYGNDHFLQSNLINVPWLLKTLGFNSNATGVDAVYAELQAAVSQYDPLGKHGLSSKIWRVNDFPMFVFFIVALVSYLLTTFFGVLLWPLAEKPLLLLFKLLSLVCSSAAEALKRALRRRTYSPTAAIVAQYPDFTGVFQVASTTKKVDSAKGFELQENGVLIRKWTVETDRRNAGDRMLTWEAMAAPVKTYSIYANPKYRNAVNELSNARERVGAEQPKLEAPRKKKPAKTSVVVPT
ncbi:transmembrane protein [Achlya hypogyna]|uniref:Transmembrane protein n=1 Tax=Achlya hypogyna TaxID=1202772 RepID=A0A1V9YFM4_ACHHY|nr:transmembrane protein [Achlya hypogyna]